MNSTKPDPTDFDEGIRDSVLMFWKAGFKTFTCCEGGHGHPFRYPTIGVTMVGDYFRFRDRLARFLRSKGCEVFEITLMSCYQPDRSKPKDVMYVEGLDLLSPAKKKRAVVALRRKNARLASLLKKTRK